MDIKYDKNLKFKRFFTICERIKGLFYHTEYDTKIDWWGVKLDVTVDDGFPKDRIGFIDPVTGIQSYINNIDTLS